MKIVSRLASAVVISAVFAGCGQQVNHQACLIKAEKEGLLAKDAKLTCRASEFEFTEGPIADTAGNVYFTDQPNDRIMKYATAGKMETFMQPAGRSNGLYFDKKGNLLACADENNELWLIDIKTRTHKVLAKNYKGKILNGPNDAWVHPSGRIYFTDPFYKRPWWPHDIMPQDKQCVYCLSADYSRLVRVADDLQQPNGIIGTPDGRKLYIADISARKTYIYDITPDGTLKNKSLFCEMGSDGMTIDCLGNIYLTGRGVTIFDSTGKQLTHIDVPERWTANICFGGAGSDTLFITAGKGFYSLQMNVHGAN